MKRTLVAAEKEILRLKKLLSSHELKQLEADEKILKRNVELAAMVRECSDLLKKWHPSLIGWATDDCSSCCAIKEAKKLLRANK